MRWRLPPKRPVAVAQVTQWNAQPQASGSQPTVSLSPARREMLEAFPMVAVAEHAGTKLAFSRGELGTKLGGSVQGVDGTYVTAIGMNECI